MTSYYSPITSCDIAVPNLNDLEFIVPSSCHTRVLQNLPFRHCIMASGKVAPWPNPKTYPTLSHA